MSHKPFHMKDDGELKEWYAGIMKVSIDDIIIDEDNVVRIQRGKRVEEYALDKKESMGDKEKTTFSQIDQSWRAGEIWDKILLAICFGILFTMVVLSYFL